MSVSGRRVVVLFYGGMGALALAGFLAVLWIRMQPVVQVDQRKLARLLSNAYQKYRFDEQRWPKDAFDAAVGFKSENSELLGRVRKAEADWGLTASMSDPEGDRPELHVRYAKPSPLEMKFALYTKK